VSWRCALKTGQSLSRNRVSKSSATWLNAGARPESGLDDGEEAGIFAANVKAPKESISSECPAKKRVVPCCRLARLTADKESAAGDDCKRTGEHPAQGYSRWWIPADPIPIKAVDK
jgi:hypothetical protein